MKTKFWLRLPLILLAAMLPFELDRPLLIVGPLAITNLEILLGLGLLAALVVYWRERPPHPLPPAGRWLLALSLAAFFLAALAAPADRANAFKAALRGASGIGLFLAVPLLVDDARARRAVVAALIAGAGLAAVLGLLEVVNGAGLAPLDPFRPNPFRVGPYLRLSGPFDYTNQAAMYLEAVLPLVWLAAWPASSRWSWRRAAALLLSLLCLQAALLTLSRAAAATLVLANLATALFVWWGQRSRRQIGNLPYGQARVWAGLAGLALLFFLLNQLLNPVFRLRLQEDEENWYQITLAAPAELALSRGRSVPVAIAVENRGELIWDSDDNPPVRLGARWYEPGSDVVAGESRWHLGQTVRPGETIRLTVPLQPPPGSDEYVLLWDMVQEGVTWFSSKTGQAVQSSVVVGSDRPPATSAGGGALARPVDIRAEGSGAVYGAPQPPRLTLWRAALAMIGERPLLGWGLDSFRLQYGPRLGFTVWDDTVHTNNWYLETLVSLGLAGGLPFLVWLGWLAAGMIGRLRRPADDRPNAAGRIALTAALFTFFGHGLLDYFLLFNATALLFWLLAGLWLARPETDKMGRDTLGSKTGDANRL